MKKYILIAIAFILLVACIAFFSTRKTPFTDPVQKDTKDFKNQTYSINGEQVTLINGVSEKETEVSPTIKSKIITKYFNNQSTSVDLDGNGTKDTIFIVQQTNGGTGSISYYLVAAAADANGNYSSIGSTEIGTNITPRTLAFENGEAIVTYTQNTDTEVLSKYFAINAGVIIQLAK